MNKRYIYIDYLRILASMAVVMIHTAANGWTKQSVYSLEWQTLNFYDSISRWGVPVFAMISGALFLSREIDIKTLYKKHILKIFIIFLLCSLTYAIFEHHYYDTSLNDFLYTLFYGALHEWYLLATIGLYIATPLLAKFVKDKKTCKYFIVISTIFSIILPTIFNILEVFNIKTISPIVHDMQMSGISSLFTYYVLGYYLNTYNISKRRVVYFLGIIGIILTILGTSYISCYINKATEIIYSYSSFNVFLCAVAIFVLFKEIFNNGKYYVFINTWSKCTIWIYLVHPLVKDLLKMYGINNFMFAPLIGTPVFFIIIYAISFIISLLIYWLEKKIIKLISV